MILSAQSIRQLCDPAMTRERPMITPFVGEKQVRNGKSYGLSAASYDLRIKDDLVLGPHPGYVLMEMLANEHPSNAPHILRDFSAYTRKAGFPPCFALAGTVEHFDIPPNVLGQICDKSTYARFGVSCFNTIFDPGFHGFGTLELVNLSAKLIVIRSGDPICQMVFQWLDEATERPYVGKYAGQAPGPQEAILEPPQGLLVEQVA